MTSVSECVFNSDMNLPSSTVGWDDIPTEIILYIFKKLDMKSIRCCFSVSRKWKEIAISLCERHSSVRTHSQMDPSEDQHRLLSLHYAEMGPFRGKQSRSIWQELAEDGMVNHGISHRLKSTLSWKDLYFNSLLWNNLQSAVLDKVHELEKVDVKHMHVYRDKLIVITKNTAEYYEIESMQSIRAFTIPLCEDVQETDDILMLVTKRNHYHKVTIFLKLNKDEQIDLTKFMEPGSVYRVQGYEDTHSLLDCWRWRVMENFSYVIDKSSVLWECSSLNKSLTMKPLARFFGDFQLSKHTHSLNSIHVIKKNVYIAVQWGDLFYVSKKKMMFRKVYAKKIPIKILEGRNIDKRPPYREGADKFDAFIKVPEGYCEGSLAPRNMLHFHYVDPEMTCGLQHGDVVFRGFEDGRVEITLLKDDTKFELNIKEWDKDSIKDPAIIGIEVCELKDMHKLFVATAAKLYTLLMTYPEAQAT